MFSDKRILAIIPARGGSKGVPRKNIRDVGGKPLIAWSIDAARKSRYIDRIIVSSDDSEILQIARKYGADTPFIRPAELARDDTPGIEPVLHAIEELPGYDYIVLLQPTSPLRTAEAIDACIELCINRERSVSVSVSVAPKSPYVMFQISDSEKLKPILDTGQATRRQDFPEIYALNGAVYVAQVEILKQNRSFLVEDTIACKMSSEQSFDIDTEFELQICDLLLGARAARRDE